MSIPKIIHYCWFGKSPKPSNIEKYMNTWKKLEGYKVIEWNEDNFDLNSCDFIEKAYKLKKYAFVSDYVRLKVLNEYGGIYLDTDVEIKKSFDDLLDDKLFLGYIYNSSIGTAIIGSERNHPIIASILDLYKNAKIIEKDEKIVLKFDLHNNREIKNNNDLFTYYMINNISDFTLDNKLKEYSNLKIYPKEYFERHTFNKKIDYCIHHCEGSWWRTNTEQRSIKGRFLNLILGDILYDKFNSYIKNKKLPYYKYYGK